MVNTLAFYIILKLKAGVAGFHIHQLKENYKHRLGISSITIGPGFEGDMYSGLLVGGVPLKAPIKDT